MAQYTDEQWRDILRSINANKASLTPSNMTTPTQGFSVQAPGMGTMPIGSISAPTISAKTPTMAAPSVSTWDKIKVPMIAGAVGLGIGSMFGSSGSTAPNLASSSGQSIVSTKDYDAIMAKSLKSVDYAQEQASDKMMENMAQQMQARGIRGSGIHQKGLRESAAEIASASQAQRDRIALDVYNSMMQWVNAEAQRNHEMAMAREEYERAEAAQKKANKWGALASIGSLVAQMVIL